MFAVIIIEKDGRRCTKRATTDVSTSPGLKIQWCLMWLIYYHFLVTDHHDCLSPSPSITPSIMGNILNTDLSSTFSYCADSTSGKNSCATPMMTPHQQHRVHSYSISPLAVTPAAQSSQPCHLSRCGAAAAVSCTSSSTISHPSSSSLSQEKSLSSPRLTLKFQHVKRRENSSKSGMSTSAGSATTTTTTKPSATASDVTWSSTVGGGKFTPLDPKASASINSHCVIASYGSTKNEYDASMISPIIRRASNWHL